MNIKHSKFWLIQSIARVLLVAGVAGTCTTPTWADLTGTTVHGSAFFKDDRSNDLFSFETPCLGICGNGPIATIGSGREFLWYQHDYPIDVDFTADALAVSFVPFFTYPRTIDLGPLSFEFKDAAFIGASVSLLSFSNFSSADKFTFALNADTITIRVPTFFITSPGFPYEINLQIATLAVPESSTNIAILGGLLMLGFGVLRRGHRLAPLKLVRR